MLTGTTPFLASERVELREQHLQSPVVPPRERAPRAQIPEEIQALVLRALAKRRDDRFADAATFLSELEETRERLIYRLPRGYQLLPRDLRGYNVSANDPTTDVPAAVRPPRAATTDAAHLRLRLALLAGSVAGAALATAIFSLRATRASSATPVSELPGQAESAAPDERPVPALQLSGPPTSPPTTGTQPEACDAAEAPASSDSPPGLDAAPRMVQARVRDTKRRTSVAVTGPRPGAPTSEQARRVAAEAPVLVALGACAGIPGTIIAELDIADGRGFVVRLNRHTPGDAVSWHGCARGVLEGLDYPLSASAARVRFRLELR